MAQTSVTIPIPDTRGAFSEAVSSGLAAIYSVGMTGGSQATDRAVVIALMSTGDDPSITGANQGDVNGAGPQPFRGVIAPAYAVKRDAGASTGLSLVIFGDDGTGPPGPVGPAGPMPYGFATATLLNSQLFSGSYSVGIITNADGAEPVKIFSGTVFMQLAAAVAASSADKCSFQLTVYDSSGAVVSHPGAVLLSTAGFAAGQQYDLGLTGNLNLNPGQSLHVDVIPVAAGAGKQVPWGNLSAQYVPISL